VVGLYLGYEHWNDDQKTFINDEVQGNSTTAKIQTLLDHFGSGKFTSLERLAIMHKIRKTT
jgi:hypothetical protein